MISARKAKPLSTTAESGVNDNNLPPEPFGPAAGSRPCRLVTELLSVRPKFRIAECTGRNEAILGLFSIFAGEAVGVHAHKTLSEDYCDDLVGRFQRSALRRARSDGVPGFEAGVTQFGKPPDRLARLAYSQQGLIREVVGDPENPISEFYRGVAREGRRRGFNVRPAAWDAEPMPIFRVAQWQKSGSSNQWLLRPHDDLAQLQATYNDGFEIQSAVCIVAVNFYVRSVAGSGQLRAFNWQPSIADRKRLGVAETGYPYEEADLPVNAEQHTFEQETGDCVLLDGSYAHGVLIGADAIQDRTIVNGFAALLPDATIALFA